MLRPTRRAVSGRGGARLGKRLGDRVRCATCRASIAAYLRDRNLPAKIRLGSDPYLAALPFAATGLEVANGRATASDLVCVSHAFGAVAETGTLVLTSGQDNPTTLNFLPDTHIVIVQAQDIIGDYEQIWQRLRSNLWQGR